jgi:hypothetical protein
MPSFSLVATACQTGIALTQGSPETTAGAAACGARGALPPPDPGAAGMNVKEPSN